MTANLFVYGTLMRAAAAAALGRDMRARLEQSGSWLGAATTAGRLFDLGRYPALVAASGPEDVVHGEVFQLSDPDRVFPWLDPYEGIALGQLTGPDYERLVQAIELANGGRLTAWVYFYHKPIVRPRPIASGRWRP